MLSPTKVFFEHVNPPHILSEKKIFLRPYNVTKFIFRINVMSMLLKEFTIHVKKIRVLKRDSFRFEEYNHVFVKWCVVESEFLFSYPRSPLYSISVKKSQFFCFSIQRSNSVARSSINTTMEQYNICNLRSLRHSLILDYTFRHPPGIQAWNFSSQNLFK